MLSWIRKIRTALRAHDRLPTVGISILDDRGAVVDLVTFRVTVERDDRDRLCLVPADSQGIWWEAHHPCVVAGLNREGRVYRFRNLRRMVPGERILLDRTWLIGELDD